MEISSNSRYIERSKKEHHRRDALSCTMQAAARNSTAERWCYPRSWVGRAAGDRADQAVAGKVVPDRAAAVPDKAVRAAGKAVLAWAAAVPDRAVRAAGRADQAAGKADRAADRIVVPAQVVAAPADKAAAAAWAAGRAVVPDKAAVVPDRVVAAHGWVAVVPDMAGRVAEVLEVLQEQQAATLVVYFFHEVPGKLSTPRL